METLPLHPIIVHVPLGLTIVAPLLAFAVWLLIEKGTLTAPAWWLVAAMHLTIAGGAFAAVQSGEADEHRVEKVVGEAALEHHEDLAKPFAAATAVVALLALVAGVLLVGRGLTTPARALMVLTAVGALGLLGGAVAVGHSGGELVYQRGAAAAWIQPATSPAHVGAPGAVTPTGGGDDHGDSEDSDGDD